MEECKKDMGWKKKLKIYKSKKKIKDEKKERMWD